MFDFFLFSSFHSYYCLGWCCALVLSLLLHLVDLVYIYIYIYVALIHKFIVHVQVYHVLHDSAPVSKTKR